MIGAYLLPLMAQTAASELPPTAPNANYPQPAYFLSLADTPLGFAGYIQCLGDYGEHLVKGTTLPLAEVIARTRADCEPVKAVSLAAMSKSELVREVLEDMNNRSLDGLDIGPRLDLALAQKADDWSVKFATNATKFRQTSSYDPIAYMENYRVEVASGRLQAKVAQ